jgi:hypothetical protein
MLYTVQDEVKRLEVSATRAVGDVPMVTSAEQKILLSQMSANGDCHMPQLQKLSL